MEHQERDHLEQGNPSGHPIMNKLLKTEPHANLPGILRSNFNQHREMFNLIIMLQKGSDWRLEISAWCLSVASRLRCSVLSRYQISPHLFAK